MGANCLLSKVSLQKTSTLEKGGGPQKGGRHGHRPRGRAVPPACWAFPFDSSQLVLWPKGSAEC